MLQHLSIILWRYTLLAVYQPASIKIQRQNWVFLLIYFNHYPKGCGYYFVYRPSLFSINDCYQKREINLWDLKQQPPGHIFRPARFYMIPHQVSVAKLAAAACVLWICGDIMSVDTSAAYTRWLHQYGSRWSKENITGAVLFQINIVKRSREAESASAIFIPIFPMFW